MSAALSQSKAGPLRGQLMTAAGAMTALQLASKFIEVGFSAVLARILEPADFGVIAGAMIFISFASMLVEIGIGATIVQLPDLSNVDIRVAGTLVLINAIVYCVISIAVAPLIAIFIDIPAVGPVLRVLSFIFLLQALGIVSENLLVRAMKAPRVMMTQLAARFLGTGGVGIGMAVTGWGYWSLVGATLAETAIKAASLFIMVRPPTKPLFSRSHARRLMRRSSGFSASKLLNFVAMQADNAIVGHTMSAAALGIYTRAYNLMGLPADLYSRIAERLLFPALASMQKDAVRLRRAFLRSLELTAVIGMPMSLILALLAPEIIRFILGAKWEAVIVPFMILSTVSYFRLGTRVSSSVQRAKGAIGPMIFNQVVYAAMVVGGCLLTYPYGIVALSAAVSIGVLVFYFVVNFNACRLVGVKLTEFLQAHVPSVIISAMLGTVLVPVTIALRSYYLPPFVFLALEGVTIGLFAVILFITKPRVIVGSAAGEIIDDLHRALRRARARSIAPEIEH